MASCGCFGALNSELLSELTSLCMMLSVDFFLGGGQMFDNRLASNEMNLGKSMKVALPGD